MIVTEFYNGQGLGNQLWPYFVTRIIAEKNNFKFGIKSIEKFKGKNALTLDFGENVFGGEGPEGGPPERLPNGIEFYHKERLVRHPNGLDITKTDINLLNIKDNTKIDGHMQSYEYIKDYRQKIKEWIKINASIDTTNLNSDICLIHVRGGDFLGSAAVLYGDYYVKCINKMLEYNNKMKFFIVTDDSYFCSRILPGIPIIGGSATYQRDSFAAPHHMGGPINYDWELLNKAKNIIISASSFSFWPVWLNIEANVIAPMYWADYKNSDGYWSCGDSLIPGWTYLNRNGRFYSYEECLILKNEYEEKNSHLWK